jgi:phage shock protein A
MARKSLFGRIAQLGKANVHAALDGMEDPGKMMNQGIRDYAQKISEAETAVSQTIGNLRMAETDLEQKKTKVGEWTRKAAAASARSDTLRAEGNNIEADRYQALARTAMGSVIQAENAVAAAGPSIASQQQVVQQLKTGLEKMREQQRNLSSKRDELVARKNTADAQNTMLDAVKSIDMSDPTSDLGRYEEKIRRSEAQAMGAAELASTNLDAQFAELEDLGETLDVDARLAALKAGQGALEA